MEVVLRIQSLWEIFPKTVAEFRFEPYWLAIKGSQASIVSGMLDVEDIAYFASIMGQDGPSGHNTKQLLKQISDMLT